MNFIGRELWSILHVSNQPWMLWTHTESTWIEHVIVTPTLKHTNTYRETEERERFGRTLKYREPVNIRRSVRVHVSRQSPTQLWGSFFSVSACHIPLQLSIIEASERHNGRLGRPLAANLNRVETEFITSGMTCHTPSVDMLPKIAAKIAAEILAPCLTPCTANE